MASPVADCFICEKHRLGDEAEGGVLFEDGLLYVGHVHAIAGPTAYRGQIVVEPKRHVRGLGELNDVEAEAVGRTISRMARLLHDAVGAEHVYMWVIGDEVPHLHVQLVPRFPNTPREYWGPRLLRWPHAPRVDPMEMRTLISALRDQFAAS